MFRTQRDSAASGAIAVTIAPAQPWELHEIRIVNASGSFALGSLTATMDAGAGSKHDCQVYANSMSASDNFRVTFLPPLRFTHYDDQLDLAYANSSSADYGIEVIYKLL